MQFRFVISRNNVELNLFTLILACLVSTIIQIT